MICGQAGLAGSTTLGTHVVLGGQVGLGDHIHIGDRAQIAGSSGVMADVPADKRYGGTPARPLRDMGILLVAFDKLPGLMKQVKRMQAKLDELTNDGGDP